METNTIQQQIDAPVAGVFTSQVFLDSWHGQRRVTRRIIEAFPEDKLFSYSIGGMRPFADMVKEIMSMSAPGIKGIVTGDWTPIAGLEHHAGKINLNTKDELLSLWDKTTDDINTYWPQITSARFQDAIVAFGQYEGIVCNIIQYIIDNEIHHRGQAYVYLRSLGIEPPAFWDRS